MTVQPAAITVIELWPHEDDCWVCGVPVTASSAGPNYGVACYEDLIVPNDHQGEWGGFTACRACYYIVQGMQAERPAAFLTRREVLAVKVGK